MEDGSQGLTERALKALVSAVDEAHRRRHDYVGAEHLLLGIIAEPDSGAATVLGQLGVDSDDIRSAVSYIVRDGSATLERGFTQRAQRAITLAHDEARRLDAATAGTEHLLLGLLREGSNIAATILERLGVAFARARAVVSLLGDLGVQPNGRT